MIPSAQVAKNEIAFAGTRVVLQQRIDLAAAWARAIAGCTLLGAGVGLTLDRGMNSMDSFLPVLAIAAPIYFIMSFNLHAAGGWISRALAILAGAHVLCLFVYAGYLVGRFGIDDRTPMYFLTVIVTLPGLICTIYFASRAQGQSSEGRGFEVVPRQMIEIESDTQ